MNDWEYIGDRSISIDSLKGIISCCSMREFQDPVCTGDNFKYVRKKKTNTGRSSIVARGNMEEESSETVISNKKTDLESKMRRFMNGKIKKH